MKALFLILAIYSSSLMARSTDAFTAQIKQVGFADSEKAPIEVSVWWSCMNSSIFDRRGKSCGFERINFVSDTNGNIKIPSIRYTVGKRNDYSVNITSGNSIRTFQLNQLNDLKAVVQNLAVYKLNNSDIKLDLKSGINQNAWMKESAREGDLSISFNIFDQNGKVQKSSGYSLYFRSYAEKKLATDNIHLIVAGAGTQVKEVEATLEVKAYELAGPEFSVKTTERFNYEDQMPKLITISIDDTKFSEIKRTVNGVWKSNSVRMLEGNGNGSATSELEINCVNGIVNGHIDFINQFKPELNSESVVTGTCDLEKEIADLTFNVNLGAGVQTYTLKIYSIRLEYMSQNRVYSLGQGNGYGVDFLGANGKVGGSAHFQKDL